MYIECLTICGLNFRNANTAMNLDFANDILFIYIHIEREIEINYNYLLWDESRKDKD